MKLPGLQLVATTLIAHHVSAQMPNPPSGCCATAAMMRFGCSRLVIERVDPLVQPGVTQSSHNHQIVGGNSFNASMAPVDFDPSVESTCTSCTFSEDFSNYWTANLYFRARNGTFKRVPQLVNLGLEGGNEGITVYYIPPYDGKTNVTAFKPVSTLSSVSYASQLELTPAPGFPYARRRLGPPHAPRAAAPALPPLLQQHATGPLRWRPVYRK